MQSISPQYKDAITMQLLHDDDEKEDATMMKNKSRLPSLTVSEAERRCSRAPHVVGLYTAGARLIGLTENQLVKHLAALNTAGGLYADSPYTQPVCYVIPISNIRKKKLNFDKNFADVKHEDISWGGGYNYFCQSDQSTKKSFQKKIKPVSLPALNNSTIKPKDSIPAKMMTTIEHLPLIEDKVTARPRTSKQKELTFMAKQLRLNRRYTDVSAIPYTRLQVQYKSILEAYGFTPTRVPLNLHLPILPQWQEVIRELNYQQV